MIVKRIVMWDNLLSNKLLVIQRKVRETSYFVLVVLLCQEKVKEKRMRWRWSKTLHDLEELAVVVVVVVVIFGQVLGIFFPFLSVNRLSKQEWKSRRKEWVWRERERGRKDVRSCEEETLRDKTRIESCQDEGWQLKWIREKGFTQELLLWSLSCDEKTGKKRERERYRGWYNEDVDVSCLSCLLVPSLNSVSGWGGLSYSLSVYLFLPSSLFLHPLFSSLSHVMTQESRRR